MNKTVIESQNKTASGDPVWSITKQGTLMGKFAIGGSVNELEDRLGVLEASLNDLEERLASSQRHKSFLQQRFISDDQICSDRMVTSL